MRFIILSTLICLLFYACHQPSATNSTDTQTLTLPTETSDSFFSNHFQLETIIPLETNDTFLISQPKRVIRTSIGIFVLSTFENLAALIDESNGKVRWLVHRIGNGPGEWNKLIDMAYDESSGLLLLLNDYGKIQAFSAAHGRFLWEIQTEGLYENMTCHQGKVILHSQIEGYGCYPYQTATYDIKRQQWNHPDKRQKVEFPIRGAGRQMVNSRHLWITAPLDGNLYRWNKDTLHADYLIDIPDLKRVETIRKENEKAPFALIDKIQQEKLIHSVFSVRETQRYLAFQTNLRDCLLLLDKEKNELHAATFCLKGIGELTHRDYYPHDGNDDKSLMFILPAERWDAYALKNTYPEIYERIFKNKDIKLDDNPMLVFFRETEE